MIQMVNALQWDLETQNLEGDAMTGSGGFFGSAGNKNLGTGSEGWFSMKVDCRELGMITWGHLWLNNGQRLST